MKLPTALSTPSILSIVAVLWSIGLPFFPTAILEAIRSPIATVILLATVLIALSFGPIPGVLVLFAVLLTFVERNTLHIKNAFLGKSAGEEPKYEEQLAPAEPMSPEEVHPGPQLPETESLDYIPNEESGSDVFEPVGSSIDEKNVIPTISSRSDVAEKFFLQQGLASTELRG